MFNTKTSCHILYEQMKAEMRHIDGKMPFSNIFCFTELLMLSIDDRENYLTLVLKHIVINR